MGRITTYRHRTRSEAATIKAKSLFDYLKNEIKAGREISYDEAILIAGDAMNYLNHYHGLKQLGWIQIPGVVLSEEAYFRRSKNAQEEKLIEVPLIEDDDADLLAEFGTRVMVTGRMARVIEAAFYQGALLDYNRLCVLFPLNVSAIRERLNLLLTQGVKLPLAGTTKQTRAKFRALRPVLAIERYLAGEKLYLIRESLCISQNCWQKWWSDFHRVVNLKEEPAEKIAAEINQPLPLIEEYLALYDNMAGNKTAEKRIKEEYLLSWERAGSFKSPLEFKQLLVERHGYTPAGAEYFCLSLKELAKTYGHQKKESGQITYIAAASTEGPGVSLKEARLEPVNLNYLTQQDWVEMKRGSPGDLKWRRIERFATAAYAQGAALSLPDIAYLASVSVDAVRDVINDHPQIKLPTRGRVADMGSTLSHTEKIIDLFMYGYTETEIERRTGHSLDSIERYLLDFSKVVYLKESGLPLPAIRQVTGYSKRLVYKYDELYRRYNTSDYTFGMGKIRRFAKGRQVFKQTKRKTGDDEDDYG